jgi:hypothetical protein
MKYIIFLFFFNISFIDAQSDSIFIESKILGFARHLYLNNLYDMAAQEYERLIYLKPNHKVYHKELLASYRKSNNIESLIFRVKNDMLNEPGIRLEYALGCIAADKYIFANDLINDYNFEMENNYKSIKIDIQNSISLLQNRRLKYPESDNPIIQNISIMYAETKLKSPLFAGVLSSILPGSGRIYAKDYTNGLLSILFIGGSAWQAYSRFSKNGVKSVSGWIYSGITLGFYAGNIFGSIKSTKKYNNKKYKLLDDQTKNYILNIDF